MNDCFESVRLRDIIIALKFSKWAIQLHTSLHFLLIEVVHRGLYTDKILATSLIIRLIILLLSHQLHIKSLYSNIRQLLTSRDMISNIVQKQRFFAHAH